MLEKDTSPNKKMILRNNGLQLILKYKMYSKFHVDIFEYWASFKFLHDDDDLAITIKLFYLISIAFSYFGTEYFYQVHLLLYSLF